MFRRFGKSSGKLERVDKNVLNWKGLEGQEEEEDLVEYTALCNWMTCLPSTLQQMPIWDLTLPGKFWQPWSYELLTTSLTVLRFFALLSSSLSSARKGSHDSGSFALESKSGIAPDKPDLRRWWMRVFGFVAYPVVKKWTITQKLNIRQQLESGIRYFDFRAAPKPNDIDLYFVHGLYGPKIIDMCLDINRFLDKHKKEIVIIHIQHFITACAEQQLHLLLELVRIFKNKVCPFELSKSPSTVTLDYLWSQGFQVFIFFPTRSTVTSNYLWPAQYLPNPWANTTKPDFLDEFLSKQVDNRLPDRFYVTQGVLTPDDDYVKRHLFSSLYRRLVLSCNESLIDWLRGRQAGAKGPNVVMTDFVEWNSFHLPRKVVALNYKLIYN